MEEPLPEGSLLAELAQIPDPRHRQGRIYVLWGLLAMLILAALHGEQSLLGMWEWGCKRWEKLRKPLGFFGVPCPPAYGTVWTVLRELPAGTLETAYQRWRRQWMEDTTGSLSIDAKTLRGSRRTQPVEAGLQVVTAISHELRVVLGEEQVQAGDLVEAAVRLLQAIPLEGKLVTADAGLLCRPVVETILEGGGDYLGLVKDNQPEVKAAVQDWGEPDLFPPGAGTPGG